MGLTLSSRDFSNLVISLWPLSELPAAKKTYLWFPLMFSVHVASQVTVLSWMTSFHLPGMLGTGIGASAAMLMVISSGRTRNWARSANQTRRCQEGTNFKGAFLGMFPASSEEARRFNSEVPDLLLTAIECAGHIFRFHLIFLLLQLLLLRSRKSLFLGFLFLEVLEHGTEITALELLNGRPITLRRLSVQGI